MRANKRGKTDTLIMKEKNDSQKTPWKSWVFLCKRDILT